MTKVLSIFRVGEDNYKVEGYGQEAVEAIMARFPFTRIIFKGFLIGDKFIPFE